MIEKYERLQNGKSVELNEDVANNYSQQDKEFFYKIIKSRISTRNYIDKQVPDELWNEIVDIANDAPSGCCRQPSRFYIESEEKNIVKLLPNIAGTTGYSSKVPHLICITADTRPFPVQAKLMPVIDATLSIQNFLLACTVNNIYTVPLNWQFATLKEEKAVKQILNIPDYEKIILFVTAGYSNTIPEKPKRLNVNWIRKR